MDLIALIPKRNAEIATPTARSGSSSFKAPFVPIRAFTTVEIHVMMVLRAAVTASIIIKHLLSAARTPEMAEDPIDQVNEHTDKQDNKSTADIIDILLRSSVLGKPCVINDALNKIVQICYLQSVTQNLIIKTQIRSAAAKPLCYELRKMSRISTGTVATKAKAKIKLRTYGHIGAMQCTKAIR